MKLSRNVIIVLVIAVIVLVFITLRSSTPTKYVSIDIERVMFEMNFFLREYIIERDTDSKSQYDYSVNKMTDAFNILLPNVDTVPMESLKNVLSIDTNVSNVDLEYLYTVFGRNDVVSYINSVKEQKGNVDLNRSVSALMNFEQSNHHLSQMIVNLRKYL